MSYENQRLGYDPKPAWGWECEFSERLLMHAACSHLDKATAARIMREVADQLSSSDPAKATKE
jgi:hypothetical protein